MAAERRSVSLQEKSFGSGLAAPRGPRTRRLDDGRAQFVQSGAGPRTHPNAQDLTILVPLDSRLEAREVDLVPHHDLRHVLRADLSEHLAHLLDLLRAHGRRRV